MLKCLAHNFLGPPRQTIPSKTIRTHTHTPLWERPPGIVVLGTLTCLGWSLSLKGFTHFGFVASWQARSKAVSPCRSMLAGRISDLGLTPCQSVEEKEISASRYHHGWAHHLSCLPFTPAPRHGYRIQRGERGHFPFLSHFPSLF